MMAAVRVRKGAAGLKFTRYFQASRLHPDRAMIRIEWIQHVITHPA
jgi:hypothetical protein